MIALWIAYSVMISILLSGAALGLEKALRLYGRSVRWVWAAVIAGGLTAPLAILVLPTFLERLGPVTMVPELPGVGAILLDPLVMAFTPPASLLEQFDAPLLVLWTAMTLVLLLLVMGGALRLARQRRSWARRPLEGDRVLISENFGPAVVGLRHPEIVLPEWTLGMAPEDLRLVMMHEREHQQAGDTQLLTAGLLSVLLMPWNLALWWQLRRLRGAVELDCDTRVMRRGVSGPEYGDLLLRMGERVGGMRLTVAALTEPKSLLEGRIRMITEKQPKRRFARAAVALGLTATVLAIACETPTPAAVREELDAAVKPAAIVEGRGVRTLTIDTPDEDPPLIIIDGALAENLEFNQQNVLPLPPPMEQSDLSDEPVFTPMTVAPQITNREEVIQAMEREYPQQLRDAGIGGRVVIWFFITETGEVADTRIKQTSGFSPLDDAALSVAGTYEFAPALNQDTPVPVWVQFPITFEVR